MAARLRELIVLRDEKLISPEEFGSLRTRMLDGLVATVRAS